MVFLELAEQQLMNLIFKR